MGLPNAIIIGAQKAGTTSLFNWLGQHPDVCANNLMKDFPYFCRKEYLNKGLDWFTDRFDDRGESIILHGYVNYLYYHQTSALNIFEYNPDVKLLVVLRDPVDRAYSAYWEARKMGYEEITDFRAALKKEPDRMKGSVKERDSLTYLDHGYYAEQLSTYLKYFDPLQIKIIQFEDLIEQKEACIKSVFDFLGLDSDVPVDFSKKNSSGVPRFPGIQKLLSAQVFPNMLKNLVPFEVRRNIKRRLKSLNIRSYQYPELDEKLKLKLSEKYCVDLSRLDKLTDLQLQKWKSYNHCKG